LESTFATVIDIVRIDTGLFEKALVGLTREALVSRLVPGANPAIWIAGHLTGARYSMSSMLGEQRPSPLGPVFGKGATVPDEADLPDLDQLLSAWREISPVVLARLAEATEAQLAVTSPRRLPIKDGTIRGALTFLAYHEGYHLGQLALIRKSFGLPGLVDA
jgi:hypothetical protein